MNEIDLMKPDDIETEESNETDLKELFLEAMERYEESKEALAKIHKLFEEDIKFGIGGDQWDARIADLRQRDGLPTVTNNYLFPFIRNIVNEYKMNEYSIKANPVDNGSDVEKAKIINGLLKHIEYSSDAQSAYETALQSAVAGGLGAFRVVPRTVDLDDVDLFIERIEDPTTVLFDPNTRRADFSDMDYCFFLNVIHEKKFKEDFPGKDCSGIDNMDWKNGKNITIAEYWWKVGEKVYQAIMNGKEILYYNEDYPGKHIPFCIVVGESYSIKGKKEYKGIVRDAKSSQIFANLWQSEIASYLGTAQKAQWLCTPDQVDGLEEMWTEGNLINSPYILYNHKDGTPMPTRVAPASPAAGYIDAANRAVEDIKRMTGIMDSSVGVPINQQSGKAISQIQAQANISSYTYMNSIKRAQRYAGIILVDLLKHYYTNADVKAIVGEDGNQQVVKINQPFIGEDGTVKEYDLTTGKFDIVISEGPSYTSQRQERLTNILEFLRINPQVAAISGDIVADLLEIPELADRLKNTLDPKIVGKQQQINPQQIKMEMQQRDQMIEQLTEALNKETAIANELESKQQIEIQKLQMQLEAEREKNIRDNETRLKIAEMNNLVKLSTTNEKESLNSYNNNDLI